MPFPVTPRFLTQLSKRQKTAYKKAVATEHPHMDKRVFERPSGIRTHFRAMYGRMPDYLSRITVKDEFEDGTTYTKFVIAIPRDEPIRGEDS